MSPGWLLWLLELLPSLISSAMRSPSLSPERPGTSRTSSHSEGASSMPRSRRRSTASGPAPSISRANPRRWTRSPRRCPRSAPRSRSSDSRFGTRMRRRGLRMKSKMAWNRGRHPMPDRPMPGRPTPERRPPSVAGISRRSRRPPPRSRPRPRRDPIESGRRRHGRDRHRRNGSQAG